MRIRVKPLLQGNIDPKTEVLGFLYFFSCLFFQVLKFRLFVQFFFLRYYWAKMIWRNTFEPFLEKALSFTEMPTEISIGFSFCGVAPFVPALSQSPFTLDKKVFLMHPPTQRC